MDLIFVEKEEQKKKCLVSAKFSGGRAQLAACSLSPASH